MLAALKASIKNRAYYWPTTDRLAFQFAEGTEPEDENEGIDPELLDEAGETRTRTRPSRSSVFHPASAS